MSHDFLVWTKKFWFFQIGDTNNIIRQTVHSALFRYISGIAQVTDVMESAWDRYYFIRIKQILILFGVVARSMYHID